MPIKHLVFEDKLSLLTSQDRKLNSILKASAKERLQLAKFHMSVLNLYEKMGGMEDAKESDGLDNVEEVLEKVGYLKQTET